ncbi:MAG TPA: hypothetical protein VGC42_21935, partial [Kofleriaceae bacterium]
MSTRRDSAWYASAMVAYATILVSEDGPVARITLNRPDKRDPIGPATCGELVHALAEIGARPALR